MCPVCLATSVGLIVAGATSAGGLTALAVKLSRKKSNAEQTVPRNAEVKSISWVAHIS
jgi:hypothetical protein